MKRVSGFFKFLRQAWNRYVPDNFYYHMRTKRYVSQILATMDMAMFHGIRNGWRRNGTSLSALKFFDIDTYLPQNLKRAARLNLDRTEHQRVLDIGSGFGYFTYIAKFFGHDILALDTPEEPLYDETIAYFMVPKFHHHIKPQEKLPEFGGRFDLITGFDVGFNVIDPHTHIYWGPEDWRYFLKDLLTNHVNPGGRIYLELRPAQKTNGGYSREIERVFKDMGASVRGHRVLIRRKGMHDDAF